MKTAKLVIKDEVNVKIENLDGKVLRPFVGLFYPKTRVSLINN